MVCNKKFLYRDAMYELMRKLQIRELNKKQKEMDLQIDEKSFEQSINALQKVMEDRKKNDKMIAKERSNKKRDIDEAGYDLQQARGLRDHELKIVAETMVEMQECLDEEQDLERQIAELRQCTIMDAATVQQLEVEIDGLEDELQEKIAKLRSDSVSSSLSRTSSMRAHLSVEAPGIHDITNSHKLGKSKFAKEKNGEGEHENLAFKKGTGNDADEGEYMSSSMEAMMKANTGQSEGSKVPSSIDSFSNHEIDVLSMSFANSQSTSRVGSFRSGRSGSIEARYKEDSL